MPFDGFLPDKHRKPDRWGFDKGLVDPEWDWFWRDSIFAVPQWDRGTPRDIVSGHTIDTSGLVRPPFKSGKHGLETDHSGSSSGDAGTARGWRLVESTKLDSPKLTLLTFGILTAPGSAKYAIDRGSVTEGTWDIRTTATGVRAQVRVDAGTARVADVTSGLPANGSYVLMGLTYDDPTLRLMIANIGGGSYGTATETTGGTLDLAKGDVYLGAHSGGAGAIDWDAPLSWHFGADRAFTEAEFKRVARNPMAPWAMRDEMAVLAAAVAGIVPFRRRIEAHA